ncbi:MAG: hypothetical protein C0507_03310 [Cyanobacteria bacterium PR.3.49]|nr:hypothetical protein [Cyanobacteria bacterium PR.3.49]
MFDAPLGCRRACGSPPCRRLHVGVTRAEMDARRICMKREYSFSLRLQCRKQAGSSLICEHRSRVFSPQH